MAVQRLCCLVLALAAQCQGFVVSPQVTSRLSPPADATRQAAATRCAGARHSAGSWTSAQVAVLAMGAAVACAVRRSQASRTTMFSKHDRRTFRGKLHGHTFGKYRLRNNKARRIQKIKNGTFDPSAVVQQGQPEPEHVWDRDNLLENPLYYIPQYARDVHSDWLEDIVEAKRKRWKEYMGKKGNQMAYKNWTPPDLVPAKAEA
eukprot:gb/GFBE01035813.1/.p1 GENE.gb/GFBE01035813.1/~~gb/GFBE01035813.1/.p1  ORF type:complete len:204 (+),score=34.90 gb/GFBE01035813.1/:1-612(+)